MSESLAELKSCLKIKSCGMKINLCLGSVGNITHDFWNSFHGLHCCSLKFNSRYLQYKLWIWNSFHIFWFINDDSDIHFTASDIHFTNYTAFWNLFHVICNTNYESEIQFTFSNFQIMILMFILRLLKYKFWFWNSICELHCFSKII